MPTAFTFMSTPCATRPTSKPPAVTFNPDGKQHGFKNPNGHHAGDLPDNINIGLEQPYVHTFTLDIGLAGCRPAERPARSTAEPR